MGELTWQQFSIALCKRFGSRKNLDPMSALSKLMHTGTVSSYITQFETMINLVPGLQDPHQVSLFLSGLRADIQAGVRLLMPTSLSHAFELALCQEDAITATKAFHTSSGHFRPFRTNNTTPNPKPIPRNTALPTGVKRLSWAEQQQRREKGLCFNCNDIYKPGHRCAVPQLLLMDAYSYHINEGYNGEDKSEPATDQHMQVSLHALIGAIGSSTMRATAQIKNTALSTLLDSGSTHNFMWFDPRAGWRCGRRRS